MTKIKQMFPQCINKKEEKMSSIFERIKKVITDQLSLNDSEVTPEASFETELGADSIDTIELAMAFEEEFDVEIPDNEARKMLKVQDVVDFLENYKEIVK